MSLTSLFWDALALGIIIYCVYSGSRKGFVRTFLEVTCFLGAMYVAGKLAPLSSQLLYNSLIQEKLRTSIATKLMESLQNGSIANGGVGVPAWLLAMAMSGSTNGLEGLTLPDNYTQDGVNQIAFYVEKAVAQPLQQLITYILFLLIVCLIVIIIRQIARLFTNLNRVPLIGTFNMILGGIMGAGLSVVTLILTLVVVMVLSTFLSDKFAIFSPQVIDSSFIFGTIKEVLFINW